MSMDNLRCYARPTKVHPKLIGVGGFSAVIINASKVCSSFSPSVSAWLSKLSQTQLDRHIMLIHLCSADVRD